MSMPLLSNRTTLSLCHTQHGLVRVALRAGSCALAILTDAMHIDAEGDRELQSMNNVRAIYRAIIPAAIRRQISAVRSVGQASSLGPRGLERRDFMQRAFRALKFNAIAGDYVEFGCHSGTTFSLAYHESRDQGYKCKLWAFDSFCGLPPHSLPQDDHPRCVEGEMRTSIEEFKKICKRNGIPASGYRTVPGFYEVTLSAKEMADQLPSVSLAYIDCVLYSSTKTVLDFLATRIQHGSIVAFDDYFCYSPTTIAGERLACAEFLNANPRFHFTPYCQYGWHAMSFIVEDKRYWKDIDYAVLP
jgi:O-methyltransferase